ncbi:hypothetical protein RCL1_004957 [Eukaryota sp. TZLM3-RCL]
MSALTLFYLGNYEQAAAEAERSGDYVILQRSRLALNQSPLVVKDLSGKTDDTSLALVTYATFLSDHDSQSALQKLSQSNSTLSSIIRASVHLATGDLSEAYTALSGNFDVECRFMLIQTLLSMNRPDIAVNILDLMRKDQPDHILVFLARALLAASDSRGSELKDLMMDIVDTLGLSSSAGAPDSPIISQLLALSFILTGDSQKAVTLLANAQKKWPSRSDLMWNTGTACFHNGDVHRCRVERERVEALDQGASKRMQQYQTLVESSLTGPE